MSIFSVSAVQTVCFSIFELFLTSRIFSFFMPNDYDGERERRMGMIRPPVSQWFFFASCHKIKQLTGTRAALGDLLGKKATRIADQCSENWWDKRVRQPSPVCTKDCSLFPCLSPVQRINCLCSRSSLIQCCCMVLDQAVKRAVWERAVRSLILPLCSRASFKLRPSPLHLCMLQVSLFWLVWLSGLTSYPPHHYGLVWQWLNSWQTMVNITRPALLFFTQVLKELQPLWVKSQLRTCLATNLSSLSLAEQPPLAASWPEKKTQHTR